MIAHRRVRIKPPHLSPLFSWFEFCFVLFLQLRQIVASSQRRGGLRTDSKNGMVLEDRQDRPPKVCYVVKESLQKTPEF
jgi:hypothetical protein